MIDDDRKFHEDLREALRRSGDLPWEELIAPLVEDGICDEEGNVLVSMPPPPRVVFDEDGNATVIYPDLSQPPPEPRRKAGAKPKPKSTKPRARADAKAKPRKKAGGGTA